MDNTKQNFKEPKQDVPNSKIVVKETNNESGSSIKQNASSNQGTAVKQAPSERSSAADDQPAGEQDLLQQVKEATGDIVKQVQKRAGSQLSDQKESTATDLSNVVNAVRQFGESLGGDESGPIARYAAEYGEKAANSLERLSTYVRDREPKQLLSDIEKFGRRRPALLIGGALLVGFAAARLIKSSMNGGAAVNSNGNAARL